MLVLEYGGLAAQVSLSERQDSFGVTGVHMLHPGVELIGNLMILESQYSLQLRVDEQLARCRCPIPNADGTRHSGHSITLRCCIQCLHRLVQVLMKSG